MISDFTKKGERFIETAMYQECLRKLSSTRSLVISGNPGEGKSRYAVELMCSKTQQGRRLFLTSAQQLENVDLEHIDGVIIDNIYGDVSFDEDKCKRWKKLMPYLIARCKNNKPFYVIVTSRSYILMKSADQEIHLMKNIELLTTGLAVEERVSIIQSHCSIDDPLPLISAFKSPIGLPQICYMYSTSDRFCGKDIFRHPEKFIKNILQTFELEDRLLFFALALVIFHGGSLVIPDIKSEEFDKINYYIGLNIGGYDVRMALGRLCGSFIQYNETDGVYQFLHDSLFETCCSYIGSKHSEIFISLSDVRVLVEFARIHNQVETADRIYTYISNNQYNISNLAARYITEIKKDNRLKRLLTKCDALFCEELLSEFLKMLEEKDMIARFLKVPDENESLLMEVCNMNQPQLVKCVLVAIDKYSSEKWVKAQKYEAQIRCKRWQFTSCLDILRVGEDCLFDDDSHSSDDEMSVESYIINAIHRGDEDAFQKFLKRNNFSYSDLRNAIEECIAKGKELNVRFETTPEDINEFIYHSVRFANTSSFLLFMKRAIASRISVQANVLLYPSTLGDNIGRMIKIIDKGDAHFLFLYCFVNNIWNPLFRLLDIEVPFEDIEYIHDMKQVSERFQILSNTFPDNLAKRSQDLKVIHIVLLTSLDLTIECVPYDMPSAFSHAMKMAIANCLSVQVDSITDAPLDDNVQRMRKLLDKDDIHLLVLYCIVNSCWKPLLSLLELDMLPDDIKYIHYMKGVSERFKTLSDKISNIPVKSPQCLKVIHIVILERPDLITECLHQSVRSGLSSAFSHAMERAISNRIFVQNSVKYSSLDDDIERMSSHVKKKDVHLLVLYCIINSCWKPLLSLLEIEVLHDHIKYIHDMKHFSKRFKTLSDKFSNIPAKSLQCLKVIHIVLLERQELTSECIHQSVQCYMPFAFSLAMERAISNRMSLHNSVNYASLDEDVEQMSSLVKKKDTHLLVLYCIVNSCWKPLLPLLEIEVLRDDIEYIHDMNGVSERFKTLSDSFSDILANSSQNVKVMHIVLLERPDLTIKCINKSVRCGMPNAFSFAMKRAINANYLSLRVCKTYEPLEDYVERMIELVNKEDVHLLALYCIVNCWWKPLVSLLYIEVPHSDKEHIHDIRYVIKRSGNKFSDIIARNSKVLKSIHILRLLDSSLIAECLHFSVLDRSPLLFSIAMKSTMANRLSIQEDLITSFPILSRPSVFPNIVTWDLTHLVNVYIEKINNPDCKEDVHLLVLYCIVNNCWMPLQSLMNTEVPLDDIEYIHAMKNASERFGKLSAIFSGILAKTSQDSKVYTSDILKNRNMLW